MPLIDDWARQVDGALIDLDTAYGAQCWDLAAHWLVTCGVPLAATYTSPSGTYAGLAGSLVTEWPARPGIEVYADLLGPDQPIQPGDVLVWGRTPMHPDTHIAVALAAASSGRVPVMTQNDGSAAAARGASRRGVLSLTGLAGIIRARALTTPIRKDHKMHAVRQTNVADSGVIIGGGQPPRSRTNSVFVAECAALGITPVDCPAWQYQTVVREAWTDFTTSVKYIAAAVAGEIPAGSGGVPLGLSAEDRAALAKAVNDDAAERMKD